MTLRLVVIGVGAHIWPFHETAIDAIGAEIVAVHDADPDAGARAASRLGVASEPTLERLLAQAADAAVVLTPHVSHAELSIASLDAGLHVLVEKPLTDSVPAARRLLEVANRASTLLAVALQHRTRREVIEAHRIVASGELGELQRIDLLASWPRRSDYFSLAPWRGVSSDEGGGVLLNQGQHDLDLVCHLAGRPARVTARTRTAVHPVEAEDTAAALLEWPDGALGSLHISTAEADEPQRIEITGTGGRLRLTMGRLEHWRNTPDFREHAAQEGDPFGPPAVVAELPVRGGAGGHEAIYRNFAAAIAGREPLVAPGHEAAHAVELAHALLRSSAERETVSLPLEAAAR